MSLPTSGFSEVANHFRRIACAPATAASKSVKLPADPTASFDVAYLAATAQRLPSTRRLDQRWDRSCGIVFANGSQSDSPDVRNRTFGRGRSFSRGFSSGASYSRDTSYKDMGFGTRPAVKSGVATKKPANMSQEMVTNYESKINRLEADGKNLRQSITELRNSLDQKDKFIAAQNRKIESNAAGIKKEFEAYKVSSHKTIQDLRDDLEKSVMANKAQKERDAANLAWTRNLPEVKRALNVKDMEETISNLENDLKQLRAFSKEASNEMSRRIGDQNEQIVVLNEDNDRLRNACSNLLQRERSMKEETGRRSARMVERPDYGTYRAMFMDLWSATGDTLDVNRDMVKRTALEEKLWRKSKDDFDNSEKVQFLRQARPGVIEAIGGYLDAQGDHLKDVREVLAELYRQVEHDLGDIKMNSHWHRELTKLHFFDEHANNYDTSRLATKLVIEPIRELKNDLFRQINSLTDKMDKASGMLGRGRLNAARTELKKQYEIARGMLNVHEGLRQLKAYQALQRDEPWEKAIFVKTLEISNDLQELKGSFYAEGPRQSAHYLELVRKADEALSQYESDLRRQFVLEYNRGILDKAQQGKNDKFIARLVETAKSEVLERFAKLSHISRDTLQLQRALSAPAPSRAGARAEKRRRNVGRSGVLRVRPTPVLMVEHRSLAYDLEDFRDTWSDVDELWNDDAAAGERTATGSSSAVSLVNDMTSSILRGLEHADSHALHLQVSSAANTNMAAVTKFAPQDRDAASDGLRPPQASPKEEVPANEISPAVDGGDSATLEPAVDADEPQTVLPYRIPTEAFRKAAISSRSTDAAFWSHELYKGPEGGSPMVLYCTNFAMSETKAKLFLDEPILGFDIEWESGAKATNPAKSNVSLIQLAAGDKIGLFHIAMFSGDTTKQLMPPTLKTILESPNITKAGVNIGGDAKRLLTHLEVEMKGLFELSHLYQVVKRNPGAINFKPVSMATQVEKVLLLPIKKDDVRTSAWSQKLAKEQSTYAAADAYAGFMLYHTLNNERKSMKPKPPLPAFWETGGPLVLGNGDKVHKGGKRTIGTTAVPETGAAIDEQEEAEEYFDALDGLERLDIDSERPAELSATGPDVTTGISMIDYPSLPEMTPSRSEEEPIQAEEEPIQAEEELTLPRATAKIPATPASPMKGVPTRNNPLPCPENQAADTWIIARRSVQADSARKAATDSVLRAYHLWHLQQWELNEVARFCRDPPLALNTVATYVLEAVEKERLPFEKERLKAVLSELPKVVQRRYSHVLKNVD